MTSNRAIIILLILMLLLSLVGGCARYATSGKVMDRIEKKATIGMSEQEFQKAVPIAQLVDEQGSKKVYMVAFGEPCFVCGSGKAFMKSFEPYATEFTFVDGSLSSMQRIIDGQ